MKRTPRGFGRNTWVAVKLMAIATLVLGIVYPFSIAGISGLLFPAQASGSLVTDTSGNVVGSRLIGQSFTDADGAPLPEFFQSRPSAAGEGYDALASSGSNQGPEHPELVDAITERLASIAAFNGVSVNEVPADAVTASASGLDPHISPAYAAIQINRVAEARNLDVDTVQALVTEHTRGRTLGFIGEPTVNVLELNLALEKNEGS